MGRNFLNVFLSSSNCNASQPVTHEVLLLHGQGGDTPPPTTPPPPSQNLHLHLRVGLGNLCMLT